MKPHSSIHHVLITSIATLLGAASIHAQTITWGSATTMSADADVVTTGAYDRAYIFNNTATINGVSFTAFTSSGDTNGFPAGQNAFHGGYNPNSGPAFPNYDNLSAAYKVIANNGLYSNDGNGAITLNNLNAGLDYTLQVWVNDSREFGGGPIAARTQTINGSPSLDYNVQNDTGGVGQFATGTFTGSGASTTLTISANASAQINGLNLRATGVSAGNTATITAPRNWGALSLGASSLLKYNISTNFSQSTAISGGGSLEKTGTGTLTLTGALSYTGATNITGGTLRLVGTTTSAVAGAARQFDASNLGLANGTGVATWNDVSGNAQHATVPGGNGTPTYIANAGTGTNLGALNFTAGTGANDSQALTFTRDTNVRTVFSIFKGSSFLMTDSDNYGFHRPGDGNPADALLANYGGDTPALVAGTTFVNGVQVNPESFAMPTSLNNGYNLVAMTTNGTPVAVNGFNKDRIYHSGAQSQAEVLIYDTVLSDLQRLHNESYLSNKWFGTGSAASLPFSPVTISNGGGLELVGNHTVPSISATDASSTRLVLAGNLTVGDATSTTFDGVISSTGKLTKVGAGTLTLTGTNTLTGGLTISAGTLKAGSNQSLGALNNAVTVSNGATLDLGDAELFNYTQPITINGSGVGGVGAIYKSVPGNGPALLQLRSIVLGSDASIGGVANSRLDIGRGDWTGPGPGAPVHIDGQGHTLSVVGSTYLGILAEAVNLAGVRIATGASVAPHNAASFGSATVTLDGGTLTPWNNHTFSNNLVVTGNGGFIDNQGFTQTYTGTVQVGGATQINTIGGGGITFNGNISGTGALQKTGGNTLSLTGNNTQTGTLTVSGGNVVFASPTGFATRGNVELANSGSFLLMNNANQFGPNSGLLFNSPGMHTELALYGHNQTIASLASTNEFAVVQNSHGGIGAAGANSTLTVNQSTNTSYNGSIRDNTGNDSFKLSLTKTGSGKLTLSGNALQYTGATTVNDGILEVNGSIAGSTATVNGGGTLSGNGGVFAAINVNTGGTLAPGNSPGILTTTGNLSLSSGATFSIELAGTTAGTGYDRMIVGGDVSLGDSTLYLSLSFAPTEGDLFTVLLNNGANPVTGAFSGLANGDLFTVGAQNFQISYFDDASTGTFELSGGNDVSLHAVPEPGSALMLMGGLGVLAGLRRRRA